MKTLTQIPQNYKKNVEWILGAYTDAGVTLPNGFQKDAIQNAAGARKTNKWKNWSCDISLMENDCGRFLVVEDSGTVGLTGKNIHTDLINEQMNRGDVLPPEERLSRFTSMFNSGGNETGGGLFGVGKSVYSVASKEYIYYFDSLREDGQYVANINDVGRVMRKALEGYEAKKYIIDKTGLSEKMTVGTRIIIKDPQDELVESIENGKIVEFIQESWWLIIGRLDDTSSISINRTPVEIPANIKNATHFFELEKPEYYESNYRVKHFGLYVFKGGGNDWQGISYYRKGMKIGEVDIKDIPEKIKGKFWGYIEVDEEWEYELSQIEDKIHFGVSKGKKLNSAYQKLKNYCNEKMRANLIEWGFIKDKEHEDKKLNDELKEIAGDIQHLFDRLGFEDLGKGPQKSDFDVRWQDIKYPITGSEKVTTGDTIDFKMRIKSSYSTNKKFEYNLYVLNPKTGSVISKISNGEVTVESNNFLTQQFSHTISNENSEYLAENRIILSVKVRGSGREKKKELPYFYDIDRPFNSRDIVSLTLHECRLPVEGSRRINFDEKISKVCYRIENKRNHELNYRLNISIHNASDITCPKIIDIDSLSGTVKPFEDIVTEYLDDIIFTKSVFEQHLTAGILELRARLIATEDDGEFEKGDKITHYHFKLYLNRDEKSGKDDAFDVKSIDAPENFKRSWFTPGIGRTIYVNIGHDAYKRIQDYPDIQYEYLKEQMLKQYVLLYLGEGKYDMFKMADKDFAELGPQEGADQVLERIESVYALSLK